MRPTVFQKAELRDENDNIIQQGTYGKGSALSNSTNDAWIDYVMNNLEALRSMSVGAIIPVETLPESGETGKAYVVTTGTDAGKLFMWDGEDWVEITGSIGDYLPITGGTITGNLSVTGNATLSGTSTAVTPAVDDNSTKVATTEYVQTEIKPIETDVTINDKRISNIEKLLQGNLYDYQTDSTSAYTKSVPSGAMPYAGLEKVGGKTVVMNQLWDVLINGSTIRKGLTITKNEITKTFSITGTASATDVAWFPHSYVTGYSEVTVLTTGHKYAILVSNNDYSYRLSGLPQPFIGSTIVEGNGTIKLALGLYCTKNVEYNIPNLQVMCIDLTLMFGAGNEPSTIADFKAMYPADYYTVTTGTLLSAGVTSVVSKDTNNATLQTYSIPASIQALEGYGWSAGSVYNYVDFERKKFVKKVDRVVLNGTQTIIWVDWQATENGCGWIYPYTLTNNILRNPDDLINIVSDKLLAKKYLELRQQHNVGISAYYENSLGLVIWQNDTSLNTATAINNYLSANPITVYYELATPQEIDISAYLTDDNLIQVESGGTLTFPNSNGDDYQIPVPSEEEYMIDLQEAINNG